MSCGLGIGILSVTDALPFLIHRGQQPRHFFTEYVFLCNSISADVIRVPDLARVTDVSGIQTYMINSSKVIFLKQRPQPRPSNTAVTCECCHRQLQDAQYCSLRCKFECTGMVAPSSNMTAGKPIVHPKGKRSQRPARQRSPVLAPGTPSNSEPDMDRTFSFDDAQSR